MDVQARVCWADTGSVVVFSGVAYWVEAYPTVKSTGPETCSTDTPAETHGQN